MEKEKEIQYFTFDYELDRENQLIKYFWADSYARKSYNLFRNVAVFDVTYSTNKYDMVFAPITIIFRYALPF